jgi:hypothetical protein
VADAAGDRAARPALPVPRLRPAVAWTDGHHLRHWIDGGPTAMWNVWLLCRRHHRLVHEGGWRLERAAGGGLVAIPP